MASDFFGDRLLLDSLPYVDDPVSTEQEREIIQQMIEDELKRLPRDRDYLAHLPPVPPLDFPNNPILAQEFQRIKSGKKMEPADKARYEPAPPTPEEIQERGAIEAWTKSLHRAQAQHNQHSVRIENLQLLETYGALAWGQNNKDLERIRDSIIRSTEEIRASTQEVNRKRKFGQMEAGEKLAELNQRWHELVQRNIEIIQACKTIQEQSKERQAQVFWEGEGIPMEED